VRILMLAPEPFFEPRGTPFSEYHRLKALSELGHHVDLVTYPIGRDVDIPNLRIFRAWRPPLVRKVRIGPSLTKVVLDGLMLLTIARRAARDRYDDFRRYTDPEGALALWSGWLGSDLSRFDLDDPVAVTDNEYLKSSVQMFGQGQWTLRDFIDAHAIDAEGGFSVGGPTEVADDLQSWVEETDVDGFNLTNVITPGSFVDFIGHVVPELQRRGVYKTAYEQGSLRHKLFGRGPRLPESHRAARYRRVTEEVSR